MDEWWTYTISDLLLFSPRTYYRMLQRHHETVWPAHVITLALGLGILGLLRRSTRERGRVISAILAMLWAWVAWSFLWKRYATINWAATYFAWLFAAEVLLFGWMGIVQGRLRWHFSRDVASMLGVTIFALALVLYPMLAPMAGRSWHQAEVLGVHPDPTALGTLGLLLLLEGRPRWELLAIPIVWCSISGATLWAMRSPEALIPPLTALLVLIASSRLKLIRMPLS